jgi:Fur family ferric uptake transcriptional regulator
MLRKTPPSSPKHSHDAVEAKTRLAAHLARAGLNHSRTRDAVVETFLTTSGHVSVEELTAIVRDRSPAVGHSTVYRTMKLLAECGLAAPHDFGDGLTRYERTIERTHHDHLICTVCGAILEFEDRGIEELQEAVAKRYAFEIASHKMELYGRCTACVAHGPRKGDASADPGHRP